MSFHLKFVMPSHPRYLCIVRAAVGELALVHGLPEESSQGLTLAVDEALANVIRHAYKGRHDQEIELNCRIVEGRLEFTLLDCGEAPDPARICGQPLDDVSLCRDVHVAGLPAHRVIHPPSACDSSPRVANLCRPGN